MKKIPVIAVSAWLVLVCTLLLAFALPFMPSYFSLSPESEKQMFISDLHALPALAANSNLVLNPVARAIPLEFQSSSTTIPITVHNYSTVARTNDPVRVSFPFAQGQLNGVQSDIPIKIQILDETQTIIPSAATIVSRWNAPVTNVGASIKFVDLDFLVSSISASTSKTYYVRFNNAGTLAPSAPAAALNVTTQSIGGVQKYIVTAGNKTFHLNKQKFTGFDLVQIGSTVVAQGDPTDGYTIELESIAEVAERTVLGSATTIDVTHTEMLSVGDQIQFEHYDKVNANVAVASTIIQIKHAPSYVLGMSIRIGLGSNQETRTIQLVNGNNLTLTSALQFSHAVDEPVSIVNYPTRTINAIANKTITLNAALGYPLHFGIGIRKVGGGTKFFSTSANNATVTLAEIEEQNPLRVTIHLISNLAEVGGSQVISEVQVEARYTIHSTGLVDLDTSLHNTGSRSITYLQLNGSGDKPYDLLIAQGYLKTKVQLPGATKSIHFGSLPNAASVSDSFSGSTIYTLTQEMLPTELDIYNRTAYTSADPTIGLMQDNFHGKITKQVGALTSTLYLNQGQAASNYFCGSGCTYSSFDQISISNQPGLRFDNGIGLTDGTQGVALLPHKYFWEEAPYAFETDGQSIKIIQYPKSIAAGVKRVGPYAQGPFGAEDFLYPLYRLFGAERSTIRSSFVFFANSESVAQKITEVKSRDYRLLPRNGDYIQSTQAFFGIEPYYTKAQMQAISWGPLQNAANHFIRYHDTLHDWSRSDNSGSVNNDPVQGTKRSYYDYQFRGGANYSIFPHLGKQRAGAFDRRDGSTGLAFTNLYEMIKLLMTTLLADDAPKAELYHWLDLSSDAMMNNFGTLQFTPGLDPSVYNGIEMYERDVEYEHPNRTHSWKQGQHMYAYFTGDTLSKKVAAKWFDSYLTPNGVPLYEGSPSTWDSCAYGRARANGWPAENAVGRYTFTGEPALLTAATNLSYYMYQCTQPIPNAGAGVNPSLGLNFDPNPGISIEGVTKLWMDEMMMRATARVLLAKQQAGIFGNDPRDLELKNYATQTLNFLTGAGPGFSPTTWIWGKPYSFDPSVGTNEIGTETDPQNYHKGIACQSYPNPVMYSNASQSIFPNNGANYLEIQSGCIDMQGVTPLGVDYQGARIISNGYHASTIAHLFRALSSLPATTPNQVSITIMKRLTRDGVLYNITSDSTQCPSGNGASSPSTGIAGGQVDLTNPACFTPIHGRLDQFLGSVFKSLPELLDSWDETFWLANNVQDCTALGGQFCSAAQQCAGALTSAIGTGGQATCCVQPSGAPVPQLCVADTIPPVISAPLPNYGMVFGVTQVTLSLATNENATCYYTSNLSYNFPSSGSPSIPAFSTTGTLAHSTLITGLPQPGSVVYRIFCRDPNNNTSALDHSITVLPPGQQPYTITNITATPADTTALIAWQTSVPTTGSVQYGSVTGLENTVLDPTLGVTHSITLTNLQPSTTYNYHILAVDPYLNNTSTNFTTFTTSAQVVNVTLVNPHYTQPGNTQESSMQSNSNNYDKQYPGLLAGFDNSSFTGKNRGLLRFDLSSIPSTINPATLTATLQMRVSATQGSGTSSTSIHVFPLTSSAIPGFGDESAATSTGESTWRKRVVSTGLWTNCPSTISGAAASAQCGAESDYALASGVSASVPATVGATIAWDVTSIVQDWMNNTRPNYGFLIKAQDESGTVNLRQFNSNNDIFTSPNANTPRLVITGTTGGGSGIICSTGQMQACTVGVCAGTMQTCSNNAWGSCDVSGVPSFQSVETSCTDGLDNDCDAAIDCSDSQCAALPICSSNVCGNLICEAVESCSTCSQDCNVCAPPTTILQSPTPNQSFAFGAGIPFQGVVSNDDPIEQLTGVLLLRLGSPPSASNPSDILLQVPPFTTTPSGVTLGFMYAPTPPLVAGTYFWQSLIADSTAVYSSALLSFTVQPASSTCTGTPPACAQQQGVCAGSVQACVSGTFATCTSNEYGSNFQSSESSCVDGLDNDCDGQVDCSDIGCSLVSACLACGNGACANGENCSTCSLDCGPCANASTGGTNTGGGGGGGNGGGDPSSNPNTNQPPASIIPSAGASPPAESGSSSTETGNPLTDVLASVGQTVVSALSSDAASSLTTNLIAGIVVLILGLSLLVYFMGWI